jgi:hypothetical protein
LTLLTTILKKKLTGGGSINYFNDLRNELLELKAVKTNLLNTDERVFNFKPFFSKLIYYNLNFHFFSRYVFLELRFFNSYLTFVQEDFYTRSWVAWRLAGCSKQTDKQVFDYFYEDAALAAVSRFSTSPGLTFLASREADFQEYKNFLVQFGYAITNINIFRILRALEMQLNYDFRCSRILDCPIYCGTKFSSFLRMSARAMLGHVVNLMARGYTFKSAFMPIFKELQKLIDFIDIRGICFKLEGRFSKYPPRVSLAKRYITWGQINFSNPLSYVEYSYKRFAGRYGNYSVKLWIERRKLNNKDLYGSLGDTQVDYSKALHFLTAEHFLMLNLRKSLDYLRGYLAGLVYFCKCSEWIQLFPNRFNLEYRKAHLAQKRENRFNYDRGFWFAMNLLMNWSRFTKSKGTKKSVLTVILLYYRNELVKKLKLLEQLSQIASSF